MIFGELKRPAGLVLAAGTVLTPIYAALAVELIQTYVLKLLPAALIISGSELACGYILLRYFKWSGKTLKVRLGVLSISLSFFILAANTINYLFNIVPGAADRVSIPLVFSALSKVLFFIGVVFALL